MGLQDDLTLWEYKHSTKHKVALYAIIEAYKM